ncbi:MAG: hypothetical protein QJR06_08275 [Alicyclobacillaceae bacterium]|nr:hypothetical protein [Alicyclobacillaceae bacterium]
MSALWADLFRHPHPILVHFPIALIVVATLYDLVAAVRRREIAPARGLYLWVAAAVGAVLAVASGPEHDARGISASFRPHERLADLTMVLSLAVVAWRVFSLWRRRSIRGVLGVAAYVVLSCAAAVAVLATGYYGGHMVYEEAIGVSMNGTPVHPPAAGGYGQHHEAGRNQ